MNQIRYITKVKLKEYNALAITMFETKKADQSKVLSHLKLSGAIDRCKKTQGDLYDKAAVLLKELTKAHAFARGNRRTAFIATKNFVKQNKGKFKIRDDPTNANVLTGIREDYYTDYEIKEWIKNGKIKNFRRGKK